MNPHISAALFFLLALLLPCHAADRRHVFIYAACSLDKFTPNSPYESNLNSLLSAAVSSSHRSLYTPFALGNDTDSPSFGLYQCRGDLHVRDCADCVAAAINQIELLCPYTCGASLQLDACLLRYDRDDFVGKLDTGLRHRKCSGRSSGGDPEFLRRRDDVLADLGGAMGFRVSAAGSVQGYAQCLGDITQEECAACLREGVTEVKAVCGAAVAGDVFLAQCYVRYWESGYYSSSPDSWNQEDDDDAGKTVAIIVGIIAGVAILVVLLSVCRKSIGKSY